jgi:hemoglobin
MNMRKLIIATTFAILLTSCAHQQTLYQRMGGTPVITAITDTFISRFSDDTRVAPTFAKTDITKFRKLFIEQICSVTGGGCKYTGRDMKTTHDGLHLTETQFNALVEDLQFAMNQQRIRIELQNELIAKLAPMRGDIIRR